VRKFEFLHRICFVEDLKEKPSAWSFGWQDDDKVFRVKGVADTSIDAAELCRTRIRDDFFAEESARLGV
jgi:hypothetical protein